MCGTCGIFLDNARVCQCLFVLCLHPQGCLQRGVRASGSFQERTRKLGSFSMWHHPQCYVSNLIVRPASSCSAPERSGTPSRQSRGIDPHVGIWRGEGAQMKWCWEPRCSPRVKLICWGTFRVASRVPSSISNFKMERGTSLETLAGKGLILR